MGFFTARVERTISAAHHNGPEDSQCKNNHGHDWEVAVEITYEEKDLDEFGWGTDFGILKKIIDRYDHKDLNEIFEEGTPPSAENFAVRLYEEIHQETNRVPDFVAIQEGNGNYVTYRQGTALVQG